MLLFLVWFCDRLMQHLLCSCCVCMWYKSTQVAPMSVENAWEWTGDSSGEDACPTANMSSSRHISTNSQPVSFIRHVFCSSEVIRMVQVVVAVHFVLRAENSHFAEVILNVWGGCELHVISLWPSVSKANVSSYCQGCYAIESVRLSVYFIHMLSRLTQKVVP